MTGRSEEAESAIRHDAHIHALFLERESHPFLLRCKDLIVGQCDESEHAANNDGAVTGAQLTRIKRSLA